MAFSLSLYLTLLRDDYLATCRVQPHRVRSRGLSHSHSLSLWHCAVVSELLLFSSLMCLMSSILGVVLLMVPKATVEGCSRQGLDELVVAAALTAGRSARHPLSYVFGQPSFERVARERGAHLRATAAAAAATTALLL